jgi:hypothetical protein
MAEEKDEKWYTYLIGAFVALGLTYLASIDYENFVTPNPSSSGKGSKMFTIIMATLDRWIGKWGVLGIMILIAVYLLYRTVMGFINRKAE